MLVFAEEWQHRTIIRDNYNYKLNNIRFCETSEEGNYYEFQLLSGKEIVTAKCDVRDRYLLDEHRWHVNNNIVKSTFKGKPVVFVRLVVNEPNGRVNYRNNDHMDLRRSNLWIQKKSMLKKVVDDRINSLITTGEKWLNLITLGHPNYAVSDQGNVKNVRRDYNLSSTMDGRGYKRVCLCTNNAKKQMFVHQLVALMFLKDTKNGKTSVDHIDRNPSNNNLTNLRWATPKEQSQNSIRPSNCGPTRAVNQYDTNDNFIREWRSIKEAAKTTNVHATSISQVCLGNQNNVGGFKWKYTDVVKGDQVGEEWRTISYEDCEPIVVSNKGRFLQNNNQKRIGKLSGGYLSVDAKSLKTGKFRHLRAHRLVIAAFKGENPAMVVNHIDGNKTNNCLENLEYVTQKENVRHALDIGLTPKFARGGRKVLVKTVDGVETEYESFIAAGRAMDVTRRIIAVMCRDGSLHPDGFTCQKI